MNRQLTLSRIDSAPGSLLRERRHYQLETLRPIVCLIYVLPFLLVYELGVVFLDNQSIRNGLDVWLSGFLDWIGAGEILVLPLLTTVILFWIHHRRRDHWRVRPLVLAGMTIESLGLALIVLWAARAQQLFLLEYTDPSLPLMTLSSENGSAARPLSWATFVSFCGAGLYEELVFRLMLLPILIIVFVKLGVNRVGAILIAVALTSLLFAAAHYEFLNPAGRPFELTGFMVRVVASAFFCMVFLIRGFGVAVGTHVAYDVLVQF
ncbi:MAG: CPBP family intramembrane glutamic endopeptidase [Pirellulaceae bacterium]